MSARVGGFRRVLTGPVTDRVDPGPGLGPGPAGLPGHRGTSRALVTLLAVSVAVLALLAPAAAVVVAGALLAVRPLQRRAVRATRTQALADALPRSLDLCTVVLGAGGTIADAMAALAIAGPEPVRGAAARARARTASGEHLDQALRWLQAELGPPLQPLTGALLLAQEQGGPVGLTLARLASEASAGRRRLGETRARRLPVKLLLPLIACSLPAVVAGAVVPLAVVALRQIQF